MHRFLVTLWAAALQILACGMLIFISASLSRAQSSDQFPRYEIFGGYSSIETNDHSFHFSPNITASQTDFDEGGHGFEASFTRNLNRYVGIMGDFSAHFSYDQGVFSFTPNCSQPPCAPVTQNDSLSPRLFNFLAGPEFKWRNHTRLTPFAHGLFGIAYTTTGFDTAGSALAISRTDAETGFAMTYGGGVEIRVVRRMSFRTSFDYEKAYVGNGDLPAQRVNAIGWSAGLTFHFH